MICGPQHDVLVYCTNIEHIFLYKIGMPIMGISKSSFAQPTTSESLHHQYLLSLQSDHYIKITVRPYEHLHQNYTSVPAEDGESIRKRRFSKIVPHSTDANNYKVLFPEEETDFILFQRVYKKPFAVQIQQIRIAIPCLLRGSRICACAVLPMLS